MIVRDEDPDPREDEELETPAEAEGEEPEAEVEQDEEPEPEETEDLEDEPEPEPQPKPVKGKSKEENFAAMRERLRLREEELDRLRAERTQPVQQRQGDPEAERRRYEAMTPEQRVMHAAAVAEERMAAFTARAEFNAHDSADKAAFDGKALSDPRYRKYASEVEAQLLNLRKQGQNAPREALLNYLIGQKIMANGPKARKQVAEGQREVRRQTTQPDKPKGDVQGKRGTDERAARKKRLEGQRI